MMKKEEYVSYQNDLLKVSQLQLMYFIQSYYLEPKNIITNVLSGKIFRQIVLYGTHSDKLKSTITLINITIRTLLKCSMAFLFVNTLNRVITKKKASYKFAKQRPHKIFIDFLIFMVKIYIRDRAFRSESFIATLIKQK